MDTNNEKLPKILVVDDDELAIKAVVQLLTRRGFKMLSAHSGREAMDVLAANEVDVLVLDVLMPEMTGLDVCRTLRSDGRFNELPIILLTGCDDVETRAAGMKLGVSDFLCKPFAHHELIAKINNQLDVRRIAADLDSLAEQL
jgi:two-component system response regulator MprA